MDKFKIGKQRIKELFELILPPLFAWFVGVVLSFVPLGIKQLFYTMLRAPVNTIFSDIDVLYICVTASAVVICFVIQEKYSKGNKFFLISNTILIIVGAIVYAICKCAELISQRWPFITIDGIDKVWPHFILIFFFTVSAFNIFTIVLLPAINSPVKTEG